MSALSRRLGRPVWRAGSATVIAFLLVHAATVLRSAKAEEYIRLRRLSVATINEPTLSFALERFGEPITTAHYDLEPSSFYEGRADLNRDGILEVVVLGPVPGVCGSHGCDTVILQWRDGAWRYIGWTEGQRPEDTPSPWTTAM